ncbi:MAG TPA: sugar phosphate isomerase/epimerase family protein [Chthonomonadaceae bacterium]|nr:sugar phosphate isomerase/epimerase family protein [Chthonomonadaceae bacterium]
MRFGVCASPAQARLLADAGYDYIELAAGNDLLPEEDDAAWAEKRRAIEALPLLPETFNLFVRGLKIVGPEADSTRLRRYVERILARAAQVGGQIIVFGSGGARNIPDGFPQEQAQRQIETFLGYCADASDRTGVVVAIEPLRRVESNILNLVSEGAALARRIARPGVRALADTFHMEAENEPLSVLAASADVLAHTHTADTGRLAPGTGSYDHIAFFRALRAAHYDARLSIECGWKDFAAEIGPALAHLRSAHAAAQAG